MKVDFYWTQLDQSNYQTIRCNTENELIGAVLAVNPQLFYLVDFMGHQLVSEYMDIIIPFVKNVLETLKEPFDKGEIELAEICIIEYESPITAYQMLIKFNSQDSLVCLN